MLVADLVALLLKLPQDAKAHLSVCDSSEDFYLRAEVNDVSSDAGQVWLHGEDTKHLSRGGEW